MSRRLRVAAPVAALALAVGLTLVGPSVAAAGIRGQHAQPALVLGSGRTASPSRVPWRRVGPGWALVVYTTATPFATRPKPGATTLYLVDPAGGKYVMYRWPQVPADGGVYLLAWSGDGKRVMLRVYTGAGSTGQLDQLTLATGRLTRLKLPASASPITYTRPDGEAVLANRLLRSPARVQLVRYSLSGSLEKVVFTLKTTSDNGGLINIGESSPYNPAGTAIALTAAPGGVTAAEHTVLISNTGGLLRTYRSTNSCLFLGWWTAGQLLTMNCAAKRLFVTPVSGARPTPLTPASTSPNRFVQDAWRLGGRVYVQLSGPACGTGSVGVIRGGRLASVAKVPKGATVVTASRSGFLVVAEGCMGSSGLLWFNPRNSAEVHVLGQNQGQGVIGWMPYYELNGS
jgi:hypothetical protein